MQFNYSAKMATEYGKRLKKAMAHAKLNQKGLIAATGLKQSTVSSAMNRSVGSSDTPAYAAACGVSALWLATGEGEMLAPTGAVSATVQFAANATGNHQSNTPPALVDTGVVATNTVADPLRSLRAILEDVPEAYRKDALTDAIHAMSRWITPEVALANRARQIRDAEASTSAESRNAPTRRKTQAT